MISNFCLTVQNMKLYQQFSGRFIRIWKYADQKSIGKFSYFIQFLRDINFENFAGFATRFLKLV